MTFISIHSVIIYVVFFGACMRCTRLCPLKPGVTQSIYEIIITEQALGGLVDAVGKKAFFVSVVYLVGFI
jgi:hypothetical protein